ncbi:MAG TPA: glycoside hydrolase family 2 protein [Anaerolineae bacterium]|nr:glycoside hydrolase family 2 protein [Anaerolineae bacterium]HQM15281.1 glycoside hydrolase family 2 protein [Anaerolineae bacterium]
MHTRIKSARFRQQGSAEWLPAQIPGSVQTDLLALGLISDPFVADNELRVQWIPERAWEYDLIFDVPAGLLAEERLFLVCDGLDTVAEVSFNGASLGETANMFRRYTWEVTGRVQAGENHLRVQFPPLLPPLRARQAQEPLASPAQAIPGGPFVRKAICQFGWDWGPQLPPVGIWKDVRLEGYHAARLADVHLRQQHGDGKVQLSAAVTLERWQTGELTALLRLTDPQGGVQETTVNLAGDHGLLELPVANPQLWWPNGYGAQPLYRVEVLLYRGDTVLDSRTFQVGLRTLELRREPDRYGESFVFVVNGVPIFAKGADWIPADSFPTRISDASLEHLIRSAAEVHMNMLRVWGGGFYEEERFYDLCDRYGILVWQDCSFACAIYPTDAAFFENVRQEVVENVRRLRHRASLALWCGNNEMEWGWDSWGWDRPENAPYREAYDRMFHHLLPEICAAEDPDTPYWPSSPSSGRHFAVPNSVHAGDTHNWEVWHGNQPFGHYRNHPSRFVSEFGFQSLPPLETVRTYAEPADWNMTSYIMEHHQRNEAGNGKIIHYLTDHFRLPKDFPALVYLSQVLQAECVRTGVEFWRRSRECTSGTLYWQLNDCWPVASWASLDYFGRWKALHYAARRFYAPVLLAAEDCGPEVGPRPVTDPAADEQRRVRWTVEQLDGEPLGSGERVVSTEALGYLLGTAAGTAPPWKPLATVYVTNDLLTPWEGAVRWTLETLAGHPLRMGELPVKAAAQSAVQVCALDFSDVVTRENRREVVLVYELWRGETRVSLGVLPFCPSKHLQLTDPALEATVAAEDGVAVVSLRATSLARFVALTVAGADVIFSDNFFDLPAGREVAVCVPLPSGWDLARFQEALRIHSLVDSY